MAVRTSSSLSCSARACAFVSSLVSLTAARALALLRCSSNTSRGGRSRRWLRTPRPVIATCSRASSSPRSVMRFQNCMARLSRRWSIATLLPAMLSALMFTCVPPRVRDLPRVRVPLRVRDLLRVRVPLRVRCLPRVRAVPCSSTLALRACGARARRPTPRISGPAPMPRPSSTVLARLMSAAMYMPWVCSRSSA